MVAKIDTFVHPCKSDTLIIPVTRDKFWRPLTTASPLLLPTLPERHPQSHGRCDGFSLSFVSPFFFALCDSGSPVCLPANGPLTIRPSFC